MSTIPLVARRIPAIRNVTLRVMVLGVFVTSGCSSLRVESVPDPVVGFQGQTFHIPEAPEDSVASLRSSEPMLNNSIIDRTVRANIQQAFEARGYRMTDEDPDFLIGYYTRARERIDVSNLDCGYGYGYRYRSGYDCYIDEFTEGMVVVDVIDPATDELIWRGSGVARVSDNPNKYINKLGDAIGKIVERFPIGTSPAVAARSRDR